MNREQRHRLNLGTWIPPHGPARMHVRRRTGYAYAAITLYVTGITGIAYGRVFRCRALRARDKSQRADRLRAIIQGTHGR